MRVLAVHPNASPNAKWLVQGLAEAGLLDRFVTGLAVTQRWLRARWLPTAMLKELARRGLPGVSGQRVRQHPLRPLLALGAARLGLTPLYRGDRALLSIERQNRATARAAAVYLPRSGATAVYAYEDAAEEVFVAARQLGRRCVYELPITYWRHMHRVFDEERELQPEWADTLEALKDSGEKLARKDHELALADHVVVASSFTAASLRAAPSFSAEVHVVPYGAPLSLEWPKPRRRLKGEPLHVVFVGHLRQRKGVAYLLRAAELLGPAIRLTLLGPGPTDPTPGFRRAVAPHRWLGPVGHARVLDELSAHHVMVFPSLAEGFGLVILEAMGRGVPVVTTPHTAGPDIIDDGQDGYIVPIRDPEAIADRLLRLHDDDELRVAMSRAAYAKAQEYTWQRYQSAMVDLLGKVTQA